MPAHQLSFTRRFTRRSLSAGGGQSVGGSVIWVLLLLARPATAQEQAYFPDPDPVIQQRLEDWQDLKFGLLMHWGAYSQWGIVESWSICPEDLSWASGARKQGVADNHHDYVQRYEALKTTFNPQQFAPEKWAAAAKEAGMKYLVFTTKHHDGFCMFDSKYTDYKITDPRLPLLRPPAQQRSEGGVFCFPQRELLDRSLFLQTRLA